MHNDIKIEFSEGKTIKLTANELNSIKIYYTFSEAIEKKKCMEMPSDVPINMVFLFRKKKKNHL